jgi:hypothetical protein
MHESRTASPLAPPTAMRLTVRLTVRLAPQVEVLEQRCVDAEKTKEEAREAAAKVAYIRAYLVVCCASGFIPHFLPPSSSLPTSVRSKRRCGRFTSSALRSWRGGALPPARRRAGRARQRQRKRSKSKNASNAAAEGSPCPRAVWKCRNRADRRLKGPRGLEFSSLGERERGASPQRTHCGVLIPNIGLFPPDCPVYPPPPPNKRSRRQRCSRFIR